MTGARAVAACALWVALGCNGTLRFDESSADAAVEAPADVGVEEAGRDAGVDQAADLTSDAGCGVDPTSCGWHQAECTAGGEDDNCELHCVTGKACSGGTCGTGCVAECQQNSSCTIAAGDVARVECDQGASCSFQLGAGANAACSNGSNCRVQCDSRCAITCQAGATCQLRCADATVDTPVTGTASCS